jgi:predicted nucleotide-binding protein
MTNAFISYSRADRARVEPLVKLVGECVDEVWWDDRFVAGESFTEETERRLNEANYIVVVWTPTSVR